MESIFNYFKQVKDSLHIMIFLPGRPLVTIQAFSFPSKPDTSEQWRWRIQCFLQSSGDFLPLCVALLRQPFSILRELHAGRGASLGADGLGISAQSPGNRAAREPAPPPPRGRSPRTGCWRVGCWQRLHPQNFSNLCPCWLLPCRFHSFTSLLASKSSQSVLLSFQQKSFYNGGQISPLKRGYRSVQAEAIRALFVNVNSIILPGLSFHCVSDVVFYLEGRIYER